MNDKKEFRFNVIDFIIILLLCFGIFLFVFCVFGNDIAEFTSPKQEVDYVLSLDNEYSSLFTVGDKIISSNGKCLGEMTSVLTTTETLVSVSVTAYEVDDALFVKGIRLARNETLTIATDSGTISANCIITISK